MNEILSWLGLAAAVVGLLGALLAYIVGNEDHWYEYWGYWLMVVGGLACFVWFR